MKQVTHNYKSGAIRLQETSVPALKPGGVLVETRYSLISAGTEGMRIREGNMSLLEKAKARPDQVKKVLQSVQQQGIAATFEKVMGKLDSLSPLGYSLSGVVTAVGQDAAEFREGQPVACAGAGYASHAEVNFVPRNLVVPVPDSVSLQHAAFTTVGAIAMQGFRRGELQVGETACVIGLGLIGQLLVQILKAAGIKVVGVDLSRERCALAVEQGCDAAFGADDPALIHAVRRLSSGAGADCVFIAASSDTSGPVELAASLARDRARIVGVGKTRIELPYNDYYGKELEYRFSRSYGPGRYDPNYEESGIDYPVGYVRWTERRNMESFLDLVAQRKIRLDPLIGAVIPFEKAEQVYRDMAEGKLPGVGVIFEYPGTAAAFRASPPQHPAMQKISRVAGRVRVGVIGAGSYASSSLLPHLAKRKDVQLVEVATSTAVSGANAARKFGFSRTSTDYQELLQAEDIDAVVIATRHATHAAMTAEAIRAGKAVFVEKPLAIDRAGAELVRKALVETGNERLQVGFNRRFAPLVRQMAEVFEGRNSPLVVNCRVHAGQVDKSAWVNNPQEGSRFIGEACHFFDLFSFLTGARPVSVYAQSVHPDRPTADDLENVVAVVTYDDGSTGNLGYLTQGSSKVPKELVEVFGMGKTVRLNNFESTDIFSGTKHRVSSAGAMNKGQVEELEAFIQALKTGGVMPIPVASLLDTTLVTLAAVDSMRSGRVIQLADYWTTQV